MQYQGSGIYLLIITAFVLISFSGYSQEKKTARDRLIEARKKAMSSITRGVKDTAMHLKSEEAFLPYADKIIRHIEIDQIGFERSMYDTTKRKVFEDVAHFANGLHRNTREITIRNNLFIRKNKPLNPYKLADNERYLRDLDFILDARIVVQPANGSKDSVDIYVITRDVFSLGGSFSPSSFDRYRFGIFDANVDGRGQRIQFNGLFDTDRSPQVGYQFLYAKNSVKGSLINATVAFTQLDNGVSLGLENEHAWLVRLDRPLVSPYTRMAGGLELSRNWSTNVYNKADTAFRKYDYDVRDFWTGYNIGISNAIQNRNRHFLAMRVFQQTFHDKPDQRIEKSNPIYNNKSFVLGSITFFNQNFYKTRYVYGFGRTEDLPFGGSVTLTAGSVKQLNLVRPYFGVEFNKSIVKKNGDFHEFRLQAEGFLQNKSWEDVALFAHASFFSKVLNYKQLKIRQTLSTSYTALVKQRINPLLTINSAFGMEGFRADSVLGTQRISLSTHTLAFTNWSLAGFRFAPLTFAEMSMVAPRDKKLFNQRAYFSVGAGIRTRNENLVFGTIELKVYYFPNVTEDLSNVKVSLISNLRVKFSSGFVRAPSFIEYN